MLLSVCTRAHQVNAFPEVGGAVMLWVIHVFERVREPWQGSDESKNRQWGRGKLERDIQEGAGTCVHAYG